MTELEKMRSQEFYDFSDAEVTQSIIHANHLCAKLQTLKVFYQVIVAAGSDVVRDVPDDVMVAGNPAVIEKKL